MERRRIGRMTPSLPGRRGPAALHHARGLRRDADAIASPRAPAAAIAPVPVVLVSIDGFRADYLDRGLTPNAVAHRDEGVRADGMTPSYPSLTFPNHYTLVTGVRPDQHGVVHNTMRDPVLGTFKSKREANASDARWWNGAEPIWVTAERAGLRTATMFWPGSQAPIRGVRPREWKLYDKTVSNDARVDQVVAWLRAPAPAIRLATLYFETLDVVGHDLRPRQPEMARARAVDASLCAPRRSDRAAGEPGRRVRPRHGAVPPGQSDRGGRHGRSARCGCHRDGAIRGIRMPRPGRTHAAETAIARRACALRMLEEIATCPRAGTTVRIRACRRSCARSTPVGMRSVARTSPSAPRMRADRMVTIRRCRSMRALFIARGPAFRAGTRLPVFDNVDVYPLLARLLGVAPLPNDGTIAPLLPALVDADQRRSAVVRPASSSALLRNPSRFSSSHAKRSARRGIFSCTSTRPSLPSRLRSASAKRASKRAVRSASRCGRMRSW
jgi:hypothetical protein